MTGRSDGVAGGIVKRWWRVGCTMHVEEALHCHDLGRLLPRAIQHLNHDSLPHFSFPILYLEEDRSEGLFDPYGNVRFYLEFHKFLAYFGSHLKLYLIDEFMENTKAISRLLITKRSPGGLPLSLKKIDFSNMTGDLFRNQVTITSPEGDQQLLDHRLHIITEATDDVNKWLFLHCVRKPVCHRPKMSNSLRSLRPGAPDAPSMSSSASPDPNAWAGSKASTRRSSLSLSITPSFRDRPFDGSSCYLEHSERRACPSSFDVERTRSYLAKVRKDFFRQMDLDFVL